jgi:hypothetical protein
MALPVNSLDTIIAQINVEIGSISAHHNAFLVSQKKTDAQACRGASIRLSRLCLSLRKESMRIQKIVVASSTAPTPNSIVSKTVKKATKPVKKAAIVQKTGKSSGKKK